MYLAKLKLWNFRKYGSKNELIVENTLRTPDLEVNFTKGLNVLIGENDSGKTAIIDAIKIILKTHSFEWIRLEHEDFYNDTTRLRIECCSYELEPNEAKNFTEWLTIFDENGDFLDKPRLKIILDAHRNKERIFPFDICAGSDDEGYPLTADAKEYLQTTYLKPLRDTQSELVPKRNSRLSRILQGHIVFKEDKKDDSVHDLVADFKEFQKKIEDYFQKPEKGKDVKDTIDEFLLEFFGEKKDSKFTIPSKELKNILETLKITLGDENLGLGSNNLLFMATELLNLERREWDGIRLGLIEEIEAHLHPQAQLRVIETLQNKDDLQFILTTHSPNLASKVKLENLIICEKESGSVFPLGYKYTELKETDYKFLERFLDVTKANLFFAKGVILVEGWAEELLLSVLAKKIGINLTERGVSIVNVASTAFLRYAKIFMRNEEPYMKIPVSIITDLDLKPKEYNDIKKIVNIETKKKNLCITGFSDEEIKSYKNKRTFKHNNVETYISKIWTLEYCFALSEHLRKPFYKSVLMALLTQKREKGVRNLVNYEQAINNIDQHFDNWVKDKEKIAFDIYMQILGEQKVLDLCKEKISKTIIAQHFSQILEEDLKKKPQEITVDENDDPIQYLLDAIKYAAGAN